MEKNSVKKLGVVATTVVIVALFLTLPVYGAVFCLISIAAELLVLRRLKKMRDHTDKRYERYARVSAEASNVS